MIRSEASRTVVSKLKNIYSPYLHKSTFNTVWNKEGFISIVQHLSLVYNSDQDLFHHMPDSCVVFNPEIFN